MRLAIETIIAIAGKFCDNLVYEVQADQLWTAASTLRVDKGVAGSKSRTRGRFSPQRPGEGVPTYLPTIRGYTSELHPKDPYAVYYTCGLDKYMLEQLQLLAFASLPST